MPMMAELSYLDSGTLCRCLNFAASIPMLPKLCATCTWFRQLVLNPACWLDSRLAVSRVHVPPHVWSVLKNLWQKVWHLEVDATQAASASICDVPLLLNWNPYMPSRRRRMPAVDFAYVLPDTFLRFTLRWPVQTRDIASHLRICIHAGDDEAVRLEEMSCAILLRPVSESTASLECWHLNGLAVAPEQKALQMCSQIMHQGNDLLLPLMVHWTPYRMSVWAAAGNHFYASPVFPQPVFTNMVKPWKWLSFALFTRPGAMICPLRVEQLMSPIASVQRLFCALCEGYHSPHSIRGVCNCGRQVCHVHWCPGTGRDMQRHAACCFHCCDCPSRYVLEEANQRRRTSGSR